MKQNTNISTQAFNTWLGITGKVNISAISGDFTGNNIGHVRALFNRLVAISVSERHEVVAWGMYVKDPVLLQLVALGHHRIFSLQVKHRKYSLKINTVNEVQLLALLFAPYAIVTKQDDPLNYQHRVVFVSV